MRKGIKILGKVFSAAVLLLIIVPVALSLLLDIPAVQNYAVHRAACFVSRKDVYKRQPLFLLTDRVHPDARLHERDGADARDLHVLVGVVLVLAHEFHVACAV